MAKLSATQQSALDTIRNGQVYMTNSGSTDTKGVTAPTVASLRKAGVVTVNGASRRFVRGKSARRLTAV